MKKYTIALFLCFFSLTGCASADIKIEKNSSTENFDKSDFVISNDEVEGSHEVYLPEEDKTPEAIALGEKFLAENLISPDDGGEIYMSINKAEIYDNLNDANIRYEDVFPDSLYDGFNYDVKTDTFIGDYVLVKLYFTIENIDAVSYDHYAEPQKYEKYEFRVDGFGGCTEGPVIYHSKHDSVDAHYFAFQLNPGETIDIEAFYLVNESSVALSDVVFATAAYPEWGLGTVVDLNLE
jgi:type III secretion system FlhB-like substrate exporter